MHRMYILIERRRGAGKPQKALHGELAAEVAAQHPGDIGLADAKQGSGYKKSAHVYCVRALDWRTSFQ